MEDTDENESITLNHKIQRCMSFKDRIRQHQTIGIHLNGRKSQTKATLFPYDYKQLFRTSAN